MSGITHTEWLAELDRVAHENPEAEGYTITELIFALGVCELTVRRWIKRAIHDGRWECSGKKQIRAMDGRRMLSPCYRPKR